MQITGVSHWAKERRVGGPSAPLPSGQAFFAMKVANLSI